MDKVQLSKLTNVLLVDFLLWINREEKITKNLSIYDVIEFNKVWIEEYWNVKEKSKPLTYDEPTT